MSFPVEVMAGDAVLVADLMALVPARERSVAEASAPYQQQALFDE